MELSRPGIMRALPDCKKFLADVPAKSNMASLLKPEPPAMDPATAAKFAAVAGFQNACCCGAADIACACCCWG